jgi:uncharacterized repeat protein (TIGR03943 family)
MPTPTRRSHWPPAASPPTDLVRGGLLVALGGTLVLKVANGTIVYYVKPDLVWLALAAAVGLVGLGLAHLLRWAVLRPPPAGWPVLLAEAALLVPLSAALALPAQPLDSAALEQRGLNALAALPAADERLAALQADTSQWTLLDWTLALRQQADPTRLRGQPVDLVGFVYTADRSLQPGEFSVVRFVVTCCAADGSAVGLPVRHTAPAPPRDSWVRVTGTLEVMSGSGEPRAVIAATAVEPVAVPATPYLYP